MANFEFDPDKSFDENVAAFQAHVTAIDPECAEILFAELDALLGDGDSTPAKVRARRTDFNAAVLVELEALLAKDGDKS